MCSPHSPIPHAPTHSDALAQWLLGYQNKEEQLYGAFEAASQQLATWFDHRGVQMAMAQVNALMEAIAAGDAPYVVEDEEASMEQTVHERVAALEDLTRRAPYREGFPFPALRPVKRSICIVEARWV